jgi:hypothetical protein
LPRDRSPDIVLKVTVTVEIPDHFAKQFHLDEASHSRVLLEAFLLQRYGEGELTAGQVGEVLGFSFSETEQFLHDHGAPGLTAEENLEGVQNLERLLSR